MVDAVKKLEILHINITKFDSRFGANACKNKY